MQDRSNRTGGRTIQSDVDTTRPARRQSGYTPAVPALAAGRGRIGWFSLQHWAKVAGITKHISFHVARHTHATMMLTLGADLYTVSKLLGHKNIATTQIYAKIVDKKKEEAIGLIPNLTD